MGSGLLCGVWGGQKILYEGLGMVRSSKGGISSG